MKRVLSVLLIALLLVLLAACAAQLAEPSEQTASPQNTDTSEPEKVVVFTDPALEAMVRGVMGKPEGAITPAEAEAVTRLNVSFDWQQYAAEAVPIEDISGLENFKNLESLDLSLNAISDITPLAGLTSLKVLVLNGNPVADIAPLAALMNLKVLAMTGCAANDYSPLANLTGLEYLKLNNSTLTDASPLASLTSLKRLYLEGCALSYSPLADIYNNLEEKDFVIASTLAEFGFYMVDGIKQACYDDEQVSVRINHSEWGQPNEEWALNCVRTVFVADEYKVDIGYYPLHDVYVVMASNDDGGVLNYLFFLADGGFGFSIGDRASSERHVRAIFPDADAEDLLLAPVNFHIAALEDALGMTATELFELPFDKQAAANTNGGADGGENILAELGFAFDESGVCSVYKEYDPHYTSVAIHRPEWGEFDRGWNIEFIDSDVNGYSLSIEYYASEGKYHVSIKKGSKNCSYIFYPATDDKGWEEPDLDTVHKMFNDALGTKEKELYYEPLNRFGQFVQERFGMGIDELYALPAG